MANAIYDHHSTEIKIFQSEMDDCNWFKYQFFKQSKWNVLIFVFAGFLYSIVASRLLFEFIAQHQNISRFAILQDS